MAKTQSAKTLVSDQQVHLPDYAVKLLQKPAAKLGFDESKEVAQICRTLARARKETGLKQEELAERSGIPQAEISRIESGMLSRGPTLLTLVRLARAMGQSLRIEFERTDSFHPGAATVFVYTVPAEIHLSSLSAFDSKLLGDEAKSK